ncbi:ABC transporter ATP-binding protein [Porphyromonas sp. COT-239 OH1446]|uniref:ABC transporter ATP-binding protein n=1 Tax=Porphyromonas sp. COT-239 OH1446 TaxID=1515613 RepID=UPI00052E051F|nr:ABC transporter ATP-binding protein [Porphyromonas sp. COT-239 OH1446]KGN69900.1 ABC transporter ATP-binding protein [Porphyromonas sp. COT-239 OH1446]
MFLEAKNVYKHYAAHTALDDVSIEVERGRVFGLLGPNGAGKTSLIRIINRITAPDQGQILIDGKPMQQSDINRIGYLPEERGLYRKMKVGEHAIYLARLKGVEKSEARKQLKQWFDKFDIMPWWDKKVEELSKGMQQKVQFVCTVIHKPELLIFDEPFSGFDPVNADLLKREILELRDAGHTIIFSTHNMQSVEEICDDIALINRSRVVLSGQVDSIRRQYASGILSMRFEQNLSEESLREFDVVEYREERGGSVLRLHKPQSLTNWELISQMPHGVELLSFYEEVPSMHEIFIQTVQENGYHGE